MPRRAWDEGVRWHLTLITRATDTLIDLAYVRDDHLRLVNGTVEDTRLQQAIDTAISQGEHYTGRAFLPQTWDLVMDRFPYREIVLPKPPLIDITSITYTDENGDAQTLATSEYDVVRQDGPKARRSLIEPAYNTSWPSTRYRRDAVIVRFRAGYLDTVGASPEVVLVPEDIKEAVAMRAAELYKQRSDSVIGVGVVVTPALVASRSLFQDYKVF